MIAGESKMNDLYGNMILDLASGMDSKMSLLSSYVYYIITSQDKNLVKLLKKLYHHEQKHLFLLLSLASQLGVDPRLWHSHHDQNEYWSPSYVNYYQSTNMISKDLIDRKIKLIKKYKYQITRIQDSFIQSYIRRLIKEELHSISLLKNM